MGKCPFPGLFACSWEFRGKGAQTTVGSPKMQYLVISVAYIIGTFKAKANITLGPTVT